MTESTAVAFLNDIEYLESEVSWVRARCKRIEAERRLGEAEADQEARGVIGSSTKTSGKELRRRLPTLRQAENELRNQIDARLAANRDRGPELGIEHLRLCHGLSEFERLLLLLAGVVALGTSDDVLEGVNLRGFYGGSLSPATLWQFAELPLAGCIKSRLAFLPTAPLLACGLITLDIGVVSTPANLPTAHVEITASAFAAVLGIPELLQEGKHAEMEG